MCDVKKLQTVPQNCQYFVSPQGGINIYNSCDIKNNKVVYCQVVSQNEIT